MARISCSVPFCRRSIADNGKFSEWICADHWKAVPRADKAIYSRVKRKSRKSGRWGAANRIWNRVKRIAIEKGAGI